jgi:hypothetical protein
MFGVFFDNKIKISMPNNPITIFQKCHHWPEIDAKDEHFQCKLSAPFCCPPFFKGISSLGVNTSSSSGNVYFANGQTERIIVPYTGMCVISNYLKLSIF